MKRERTKKKREREKKDIKIYFGATMPNNNNK
jgi:hypothetical protein